MKYNKKICKMLDEVVERLKEENEIIQFGNNDLERYVGNYIVSSMLQYKDNNNFEKDITEIDVVNLYNYNGDSLLLRDIIEFIYGDMEHQYPLFLNFEICYEMIINFCNGGLVKCLNCGNVFYHKGRLNVDENGLYTQCSKCNATFDVE